MWREERGGERDFYYFYLNPSRALPLHYFTSNNKENDEKTYNFNQKKFYFIFTLRIYIGYYYKYKKSLNFIAKT